MKNNFILHQESHLKNSTPMMSYHHLCPQYYPQSFIPTSQFIVPAQAGAQLYINIVYNQGVI